MTVFEILLLVCFGILIVLFRRLLKGRPRHYIEQNGAGHDSFDEMVQYAFTDLYTKSPGMRDYHARQRNSLENERDAYKFLLQGKNLLNIKLGNELRRKAALSNRLPNEARIGLQGAIKADKDKLLREYEQRWREIVEVACLTHGSDTVNRLVDRHFR